MNNNPALYGVPDRLVSEECSRDRREGFQVLMEEWGTSGRQRPTVADLLAILQISKLYRAMDYLTVNVLKGKNTSYIKVLIPLWYCIYTALNLAS